MRCLITKVSVFFLMIPTLVYAGWQVATPQSTIPREPFFQAGTQQDTSFIPSYGTEPFPNKFANLGRPAPVYAITVCGSLKQNLERIMDRYHWKVIWKYPYDYNFDGRVTGASLPNVIEKLLQPFPLKAVMYMSNRTLVIVPRKS